MRQAQQLLQHLLQHLLQQLLYSHGCRQLACHIAISDLFQAFHQGERLARLEHSACFFVFLFFFKKIFQAFYQGERLARLEHSACFFVISFHEIHEHGFRIG